VVKRRQSTCDIRMSVLLKEIKIPEKENYTYEDYAKLPEGAPYQLMGGTLVMTPVSSTYHQIISMKLEVRLANFVIEKDLGIILNAPIDVYFEETETYQPDIIFISKDKLHIIEPQRINGAPDIVIEILSPSTAYYDLRKKLKIYEKHGVREYWIVDPESKSVEVHENKESKFRIVQEVEGEGKVKSSVLEGFEVELKDIF
jgi:Uma2 family endonuclease